MLKLIQSGIANSSGSYTIICCRISENNPNSIASTVHLLTFLSVDPIQNNYSEISLFLNDTTLFYHFLLLGPLLQLAVKLNFS